MIVSGRDSAKKRIFSCWIRSLLFWYVLIYCCWKDCISQWRKTQLSVFTWEFAVSPARPTGGNTPVAFGTKGLWSLLVWLVVDKLCWPSCEHPRWNQGALAVWFIACFLFFSVFVGSHFCNNDLMMLCMSALYWSNEENWAILGRSNDKQHHEHPLKSTCHSHCQLVMPQCSCIHGCDPLQSYKVQSIICIVTQALTCRRLVSRTWWTNRYNLKIDHLRFWFGIRAKLEGSCATCVASCVHNVFVGKVGLLRRCQGWLLQLWEDQRCLWWVAPAELKMKEDHRKICFTMWSW